MESDFTGKGPREENSRVRHLPMLRGGIGHDQVGLYEDVPHGSGARSAPSRMTRANLAGPEQR